MPKSSTGLSLAIEYFREEDGRWLADISALPGVTAYGRTRKQATAAVQALALRLIADRREHGEAVPGPMNDLLHCRLRSPSALRPRLVRHPPQSGWLDELGRLKGGRPWV